MISSFWYGLTLPFRSARLILSHKALLFWSILPVAITLTLYVFVVTRLQVLAQDALGRQLVAWGWDPAGWSAWGLGLLAKIILLLVGAFTFSAASSVVSSPFNDFLAEKTERFATPPLPAVPDMGLSAKVRLIFVDLGKALAAGCATVLAILLSWVPIVNLFVFGLMFFLIAFQYVSYPQTRRGLGLREGMAFLRHHKFACLGFGAGLSFLFAIPIVSSLFYPMAVVGGTLLVARAQGQPRLR